MTLTASIAFFCSCSHCVANHPLTALGTRPQRWVTISAPRSIPLGTRVFISGGIGWRTVESRTRKDIDGWDVYVGSDRGAHKRAKRLGKQTVKITIP